MKRDSSEKLTGNAASGKDFYFKDGRMYISRRAERRFYFLLTMLVLLLGLMDHLRLFN